MIDGTVGMGGHAAALLEGTSAGVRLLGLDADPEALARAGERLAPLGDRVRLERASFRDLLIVARRLDVIAAQSILLDLGISSFQLDESGRGFSFQTDEPLDMRIDPAAGPRAADLLNALPEAGSGPNAP